MDQSGYSNTSVTGKMMFYHARNTNYYESCDASDLFSFMSDDDNIDYSMKKNYYQLSKREDSEDLTSNPYYSVNALSESTSLASSTSRKNSKGCYSNGSEEREVSSSYNEDDVINLMIKGDDVIDDADSLFDKNHKLYDFQTENWSFDEVQSDAV